MKSGIAPSLSLPVLRAAVGEVCAHHPVAKLELFGSQAGGFSKADSDVDLLVEFLPESRAGLLEMGALQDELAERLGRRVDLLSRRAVERSRNSFRRRSILKNPVTLYAR